MNTKKIEKICMGKCSVITKSEKHFVVNAFFEKKTLLF